MKVRGQKLDFKIQINRLKTIATEIKTIYI